MFEKDVLQKILCIQRNFISYNKFTILRELIYQKYIKNFPLCRWFRFAQLAKGKKFRP